MWTSVRFSYSCYYQCRGRYTFSKLLVSSLLFSWSSKSIYPEWYCQRVSRSLNKGPVALAWFTPSPAVQIPPCDVWGVVPGMLCVLFGTAALCPCETHIQGVISPPQNAEKEGQLHSGKRMWVGLEGEMVHEKVVYSLLLLASFLCWLGFMLELHCCGSFQ